MIIYQLHECGGEWEDYHDYIIGSYLRKERAEEEKTKAEAKEKELIEHGKRCQNCPFLGEEFEDLDNLMSEYSDYCNEAKLVDEGDYGVGCENYYLHWNENSFYVKEVEVEE